MNDIRYDSNNPYYIVRHQRPCPLPHSNHALRKSLSLQEIQKDLKRPPLLKRLTQKLPLLGYILLFDCGALILFIFALALFLSVVYAIILGNAVVLTQR